MPMVPQPHKNKRVKGQASLPSDRETMMLTSSPPHHHCLAILYFAFHTHLWLASLLSPSLPRFVSGRLNTTSSPSPSLITSASDTSMLPDAFCSVFFTSALPVLSFWGSLVSLAAWLPSYMGNCTRHPHGCPFSLAPPPSPPSRFSVTTSMPSTSSLTPYTTHLSLTVGCPSPPVLYIAGSFPLSPSRPPPVPPSTMFVLTLLPPTLPL
ncbi:hypothetical protein BJV74DRAFT_516540 [Russula compacta]|nr:hypothetical protein BJV74DRAFT_516540 [Russula compacta]